MLLGSAPYRDSAPSSPGLYRDAGRKEGVLEGAGTPRGGVENLMGLQTLLMASRTFPYGRWASQERGVLDRREMESEQGKIKASAHKKAGYLTLYDTIFIDTYAADMK